MKKLVIGVIPSLPWLRHSQSSMWSLFIVMTGCELMLSMPQNTQENSHCGGQVQPHRLLACFHNPLLGQPPKNSLLPTCPQNPIPEWTLHAREWQMEYSRQWGWGDHHAAIFQGLSSLQWFVKTALWGASTPRSAALFLNDPITW